jgi:hypothetical protein
MGGLEGQEFTELLKFGSLERSEIFGCCVCRKFREVWEVREVENFFRLDRPEIIGGLVAKKNFFRSGGLRGREDEEDVRFLSKKKNYFFNFM